MSSMQEIEKARNPSKFVSGFEDDEGSNSGMDDEFVIDSSELFGGDVGGDVSPDASAMFDTLSGFGDGLGGGAGLNSLDTFNTGMGLNGQAGTAKAEPDRFDKAIDVTFESAGSTFEVLKVLFGSVKNRNADDWGVYSKNLLYTGCIFFIVGIALAFIGFIGRIGMFHFFGLPINMMFSGLLCLGTSLIGISGAALKLLNIDDSDSIMDEDSIPANKDENADDLFCDFDNDEDDEDVDLYSSSFENILKNLDDEDDTDEVKDSSTPFINNTSESSDDTSANSDLYSRLLSRGSNNNNLLDSVPEHVPIVNRPYLLDLFKDFLVGNIDNFSQVTEHDPESDYAKEKETLAIDAFASAAGKEVADLAGKTCLLSLTETLFSFTFKIKRINTIRVQEDKLRDEMSNYFSEESTNPNNPDEGKVSATLSKERDTYVVTVTKPKNNKIVTLRDCLNKSNVYEYFKDVKNEFPVVVGINDNGIPLFVNAKDYDSMMIAGKPRSGKSWYITSLIMQLQMFNLPEDVQFIYIDPKESYLFKCLSYMPHCCGLHNHKNALPILDDIIEKEAVRRKQLFADNQCDTIWTYRKLIGKIPVLYIVIDEYMTVNSYYSDRASELKGRVQTVLSQLPSLGIRIMIVPHRAQGVVDKTSRSLFSFAAAIKADNDVVKETLDIKSWDRRLTMPGDTALKTASNIGYVRGAALTLSDEENQTLIKTIAKAFYKMGVDIPDMSSIGCGYNRSEEEIREALEIDSGTSEKVQYNASKLKSALEKI